MELEHLPRTAVLQAIREFDKLEREGFFCKYGYARAKTHWIVHKGRHYDMKPIWAAAHGHVEGREPANPRDRASSWVKRKLENLNFKIFHHGNLMANEGRHRWRIQKSAERDPRLKNKVMDRNKAGHGGWFTCEACGFKDRERSMFDAHHLNPLASGERKSELSDLAVLCPTCHRWAHAKAGDRLHPLPVAEICKARGSG